MLIRKLSTTWLDKSRQVQARLSKCPLGKSRQVVTGKNPDPQAIGHLARDGWLAQATCPNWYAAK